MSGLIAPDESCRLHSAGLAKERTGFAIPAPRCRGLRANPMSGMFRKIFEPSGMKHSAPERDVQMLAHLSKGYTAMAPSTPLSAILRDTPHSRWDRDPELSRSRWPCLPISG